MDDREGRITEVGRHTAPWGKDLTVQAVQYDSGLRLARLRIREGHRFTVVDLDAASAAWLAEALAEALRSDTGHSAPQD